jgi:hypothetical protein
MTLVFEHPTVAALAAWIAEEHGADGDVAVRPVLAPHSAADTSIVTDATGTALHPLSANQEQMLVLWSIDKQGNAYNMPHVQHVADRLDPDALRRCVLALVERHQVLRTHIVVEDKATDSSMQRVRPMSEVSLELEAMVEEDTGSDDGAAGGAAFVARLCEAPFDLEGGEWARFGLLQHSGRSGGGSTLVMALHHIAGDGWSFAVRRADGRL